MVHPPKRGTHRTWAGSRRPPEGSYGNVTALRVPLSRLSADDVARDEFLCEYFCERVPTARREGDEWVIETTTAPTVDFYPDDRLGEGIAWWDPTLEVGHIPLAARDMGGWHLALNDAWTLAAWTDHFQKIGSVPKRIVVLHVDDHDDLMSPRLSLADNRFVDLLTGEPVDLTHADSVRSAIYSGAIAQGSFLAPLIHAMDAVDIRHLCQTRYAKDRVGSLSIEPMTFADDLIAPGAERPAVRLNPEVGRPGSTYRATSDATEWVSDLPDGEVLLHVDFDYFNNRFNGDSDWRTCSDRHDPSLDDVLDQIRHTINAVAGCGRPVASIAAALSPGFFPAEMWEAAVTCFSEAIRPVLDLQ